MPAAFIQATTELEGNVSILLSNNTTARAILSYGTYNAQDRELPRTVNLRQVRVEANSTAPAQTLPCARNIDFGSQTFVDWVLQTLEPEDAGFETEVLNAEIFFSDQPADAEGADSPTAGAAEPLRLKLGIDYGCGDQILVSFVADPDAPGGFRLDHVVIPEEIE